MAKLKLKGYKIKKIKEKVHVKRCWSAPGQTTTVAILNLEDGIWTRTNNLPLPRHIRSAVEQAYA